MISQSCITLLTHTSTSYIDRVGFPKFLQRWIALIAFLFRRTLVASSLHLCAKQKKLEVQSDITEMLIVILGTLKIQLDGTYNFVILLSIKFFQGFSSL